MSSKAESTVSSKCPIKINSSGDKSLPPSPTASEITVKEFLDFLKTAYQVHDSLEGVLLENGLTETVDWIKLKESELVKPKDVSCQTSESKFKSCIGIFIVISILHLKM